MVAQGDAVVNKQDVTAASFTSSGSGQIEVQLTRFGDGLPTDSEQETQLVKIVQAVTFISTSRSPKLGDELNLNPVSPAPSPTP